MEHRSSISPNIGHNHSHSLFEGFDWFIGVEGNIPQLVYGKEKKRLKLFQQMLASWKDSNKGLFSIFSSDSAPPPLISQSYYTVSPWATYLLLLVESTAYPTFYQAVYECLAKKEKNTLEYAVKVNIFE